MQAISWHIDAPQVDTRGPQVGVPSWRWIRFSATPSRASSRSCLDLRVRDRQIGLGTGSTQRLWKPRHRYRHEFPAIAHRHPSLSELWVRVSAAGFRQAESSLVVSVCLSIPIRGAR